jgi:hypothetical protein
MRELMGKLPTGQVAPSQCSCLQPTFSDGVDRGYALPERLSPPRLLRMQIGSDARLPRGD